MVSVDSNIQEVSQSFVDDIFKEVDANGDNQMTVAEALLYIENHPEVKDIYGMFGRSMAGIHDSFGDGIKATPSEKMDQLSRDAEKKTPFSRQSTHQRTNSGSLIKRRKSSTGVEDVHLARDRKNIGCEIRQRIRKLQIQI